MRFDNFCNQTYQSWSANTNAERCINLYGEIAESSGAKSRIALYSTPGLTTFATLPKAPVRGLWAGEDVLYGVADNTLYQIFSDGTSTRRGDVGSDAPIHSPVQIVANGTQLLIVSAGQAWIDSGGTPDTVFGVVSAPVPADDSAPLGSAANTVGTAKTACFLDGYFIAAKPDSKRFYFSELYDGHTWDELEFSIKEGYPDNISSIVADHEELWLFGSHFSTEVWRNEGDPDAAGGFRRDPGAFIHCAIVAPWSVVSLASGLHFLGGDTRGRIVAYRAQGFQPVRVSTHGIEQIWSDYATVWDAYAWSYIEEGHQFWVISFQTANATWVYDMTTQLWHERAFWNGSALEKHRGRCGVFVFGKHLIGDHTTGKIYQMSHDLYTDDGTPIRRVRQAPHIANENQRMFHHSLGLDMELNGALPSVSLDWSDDDGTTFTTPRTITPSRSALNARSRLEWRRLGVARDRVYRVTTSSNTKIAITDATLNITPGVS